MKQIDDLSDNIEQVKKISPKTSVLIAEQIIDLVEEFTLRLANANSLVWEPIQEGDIESIDRMCRSLMLSVRFSALQPDRCLDFSTCMGSICVTSIYIISTSV